jgi:hypothetical protein
MGKGHSNVVSFRGETIHYGDPGKIHIYQEGNSYIPKGALILLILVEIIYWCLGGLSNVNAVQ